ncbi:hypothetical protein IC006_0957 [Sulfuracidifex tepidarius]|uniref:Uncharacterized protein n=1 Tax=Sulfuracidifex tepidarius TaxID=1294262 RepID=A0A510E2Y2_9CREN|nr:hypothetical protein IC006_0957 [Sulfuracidifex tepidarius]BBG26418.1 hypothetical protein IC007_0926 [Sulfuracidifex tepidarius]
MIRNEDSTAIVLTVMFREESSHPVPSPPFLLRGVPEVTHKTKNGK